MRQFNLEQMDGDGGWTHIAEGFEDSTGRAILTWKNDNPEVSVYSTISDMTTIFVDAPMSRIRFTWADE